LCVDPDGSNRDLLISSDKSHEPLRFFRAKVTSKSSLSSDYFGLGPRSEHSLAKINKKWNER
jgi:hypothetical protein